MPCGLGLLARFAIWPPCFKQTVGRSEPRIERFVDATLLEHVHRDERQLVNGFTEFRDHASRSNERGADSAEGRGNLPVRSDGEDF